MKTREKIMTPYVFISLLEVHKKELVFKTLIKVKFYFVKIVNETGVSIIFLSLVFLYTSYSFSLTILVSQSTKASLINCLSTRALFTTLNCQH